MAGTGTWRYHVYGKDNKEVKVSEYDYDTEEAARAAAAEYVESIGPHNEFWYSGVTRK